MIFLPGVDTKPSVTDGSQVAGVGERQTGCCPGTRKDLRRLSWNMLSRHLALSGKKETELALNQVINFDSCSWLHKTASCRSILHCHISSIKPSKDVSTSPSEIFRASLLTDVAGTYYCGCFLLVNLTSIHIHP